MEVGSAADQIPTFNCGHTVMNHEVNQSSAAAACTDREPLSLAAGISTRLNYRIDAKPCVLGQCQWGFTGASARASLLLSHTASELQGASDSSSKTERIGSSDTRDPCMGGTSEHLPHKLPRKSTC